MSFIIFVMLYCKLVSRSGTYLIMKNYIFCFKFHKQIFQFEVFFFLFMSDPIDMLP